MEAIHRHTGIVSNYLCWSLWMADDASVMVNGLYE